jgi:hypothetical protein
VFAGAGVNYVDLGTGEVYNEIWRGEIVGLGKVTTHVTGWMVMTDPKSFRYTGSFVAMLNRTGESLVGACKGMATIIDDRVEGQWTCHPTGGTGRFEHSRGQWTVDVHVEHLWIHGLTMKNRLTLEGQGNLSYASKAKPVRAAAITRVKAVERFKETAQVATISMSGGFPDTGSVIVTAGVQTTKPGGSGAEVNRATITGHPSANSYDYKATGVEYYGNGTVRSRLTGTFTIQADGSVTHVGRGQIVGGTGVYKGATGKFTFTGSAPSATAVTTFRITGTLSR